MTVTESRVRTIEGLLPRQLTRELLQASQPLVFKGLAAKWPSVVAATQGNHAVLGYLRKLCADREVMAFRGLPGSRGRYFYNDDLSGFNFERYSARVLEVLQVLESGAADAQSQHLYMGSTPVESCFPGFVNGNEALVDDPSAMVSIWMGNQSRIAAHFDTPDNIACVVAGRRRFTLLPPEEVANLYIGPLDFTPAGQAISMVDFAQPDLERFPRFSRALAAASVAELDPGDALFIPSMWWHHVEALEPVNVLINYWWHSGYKSAGNPLNALILALMTIKDLPPSQRQAWRGLFEHYIFSDDATSVSHLPAARRGVLGELDAATLRQLRAMFHKRSWSEACVNFEQIYGRR